MLKVDEFESEVEGLASTKRGKKPPPRLAHFEESISRHKQHVLRLEQMLRLLDNESLSVEEVTETRDMVDDYLERNQV
jgi:CCR4-NOT transcription complex subunit 3